MRIIETKDSVDLDEVITVEMTLAELTTVAALLGTTNDKSNRESIECAANIKENHRRELLEMFHGLNTPADIIYRESVEYLQERGVYKRDL